MSNSVMGGNSQIQLKGGSKKKPISKIGGDNKMSFGPSKVIVSAGGNRTDKVALTFKPQASASPNEHIPNFSSGTA